MVPLVRIRMAVTRAFALTDGRARIAVRISTIVPKQHASMGLPVLMALAASIVVVYREKLVYCVTWMMLAHRIPAIPMLFATQAQLMDRILAPVHRDTKELTAPKILTNAIRDHRANTMVFALIHPDLLRVIAHKDSLDLDAKPMSMNVRVIHAKMTAVALTIQEHFDAFACQV